MIRYGVTSHPMHLKGILVLQQANLPDRLTREDMLDQGFVTVSHTPAQLQRLHDIEPSVIALKEDQVVGYVLAMTAASRNDIPVLVPMFDLFETLLFRGRPVSDYTYMLIGQVCVDKTCRGHGVFDQLYQTYLNQFRHRYDFAITEIAIKNTRSMKAHERLGFKVIHTYTSPEGEEWAIVVLEW